MGQNIHREWKKYFYCFRIEDAYGLNDYDMKIFLLSKNIY